MLILLKKKGIQVQWLEPYRFDQRFSGEHQGIACITHSFDQTTISDIINDQPPIVLMADHLQDPHNFGAICRTAEAFGIQHICYPKNRAVQITPSVVKASAGAIETMKLCKLTNINQALKELAKNGYWVYGASSNIGQPIDSITFNFPMVIICGSEHDGISPGLTKVIDEFVHIPLLGETSSLNVSVATGIIIHKIASQK
ncbi:23S rRNA (guanosine(2251)-2'-O)-methyltransferase RlmB [Candidatus Marinamargulisbacteria bacterium SCGC AG-343-K17]|nr:23S rRNA (guanosine(2251)-2'-O)-methyltransferase RlmB [Candidatus Marinamargulisbacteria bacterium SCGC AG-343-K17]